jgi:hypothetical protein
VGAVYVPVALFHAVHTYKHIYDVYSFILGISLLLDSIIMHVPCSTQISNSRFSMALACTFAACQICFSGDHAKIVLSAENGVNTLIDMYT